MLTALKSRYLAQTMHPGPLGMLVNPFYFARRALLMAMRELGHELGGRVLDVGCGDCPYEHLIGAREYAGLELDTPESRARNRADAFYDGHRFPFADGSFDGVLCTQVLEHVFAPDDFLRELARVLRVDGRLLLTVSRNPHVNLLTTLVLMAPLNVLGTLQAWITPSNPDFYVDNVVLARKAARAA